MKYYVRRINLESCQSKI